MRKEEFCEILGDIGEKHITEARAGRKAKKAAWIKWSGLAAGLCLVAFSALLVRHIGTPGADIVIPNPDIGPPDTNIGQPGETKLVVNEADNPMNLDMDVQISHYTDITPVKWEAVMEEFENSIGFSYGEFMKKLPAAYQSTAFYSIDAPTTPKSTEYVPHDYVFEFFTEHGGTVEIALCAAEEPLRDCFPMFDQPKESEINGTAAVIYGFRDSFMVQFSYENVNYDIETKNITLEELENLLTGMLNGAE